MRSAAEHGADGHPAVRGFILREVAPLHRIGQREGLVEARGGGLHL